MSKYKVFLVTFDVRLAPIPHDEQLALTVPRNVWRDLIKEMAARIIAALVKAHDYFDDTANAITSS
jgi:hypothetical protein